MTLWPTFLRRVRRPTSLLGVFLMLWLGMIALVLQSVREHEAGDLIVYQNGEQVGAFVLLVIFPFLVAAAWFLMKLPRERFRSVSLRWVLLGVVVLALPLLAVPPVVSGDAYYSLYYGQTAAAGLNPYTTTIGEHFIAPFAAIIHPIFYDLPTPYGPLWSGVMEAMVRLTDSRVFTGLFGLRLLSLLAFLGSLILVARTVRGHKGRRAAALIGWNPLVLLYFVNEAHNDALVFLAFAGAVFLVLRRRHLLAGLVLIAAGLIKWVPFLLLPLVVADAFGRRSKKEALRLMLILGGVAAAAVAAGFLPYWDGGDLLRGVREQSLLLNTSFFVGQESFLLGFWEKIELVTTPGVNAVRIIGLLVFLGLTGWLVRQIARTRIPFSEGAFLEIFLFLVFAVSWFMPWYLLWLIPFAASHDRYFQVVLGITLVFLGLYLLPLTIGAPLLIVVVATAYGISRIRRALTAHASPPVHESSA